MNKYLIVAIMLLIPALALGRPPIPVAKPQPKVEAVAPEHEALRYPYTDPSMATLELTPEMIRLQNDPSKENAIAALRADVVASINVHEGIRLYQLELRRILREVAAKFGIKYPVSANTAHMRFDLAKRLGQLTFDIAMAQQLGIPLPRTILEESNNK